WKTVNTSMSMHSSQPTLRAPINPSALVVAVRPSWRDLVPNAPTCRVAAARCGLRARIRSRGSGLVGVEVVGLGEDPPDGLTDLRRGRRRWRCSAGGAEGLQVARTACGLLR